MAYIVYPVIGPPTRGSESAPLQPPTPGTNECLWRAEKVEERWREDAYQIQYWHALQYREAANAIRSDDQPQKNHRIREVKRERRELCQRDIINHRDAFMNKLKDADMSVKRKISSQDIWLNTSVQRFSRILRKGPPASWPKPEDRMLRHTPRDSSGQVVPGSDPSPAPWVSVQSRAVPTVSPFTQYMTPIPIHISKAPGTARMLTIPNNSDIKRSKSLE